MLECATYSKMSSSSCGQYFAKESRREVFHFLDDFALKHCFRSELSNLLFKVHLWAFGFQVSFGLFRASSCGRNLTSSLNNDFWHLVASFLLSGWTPILGCLNAFTKSAQGQPSLLGSQEGAKSSYFYFQVIDDTLFLFRLAVPWSY